jgi:acrylyl-CoA reductase (NADPH)
MTDSFLAWRLFKDAAGFRSELTERRLTEIEADGDVLIRGAYAGVNFKDALAGLDRAPIVRNFPCTGGIELTGTVERSADARFSPGDPVIVHGFGLSAERDGGFTQFMKIPADMVVKLPKGLSLLDAGTIGAAGYTAALSIDALELNGLSADGGPVAVNGATGGVASIAIDMLAGRGYQVSALSRKPDDGWLRGLGAYEVLSPPEVGARPLERGRWAGAIDSLGGAPLDQLLRTMLHNGLVASFGNAAGNDLATSMMPLILRGVRLIGINANSPMLLRERIWGRIAGDLRPRHLTSIARLIPMADLQEAFEALIEGRGRGRFVVDLRAA